MIGTTLSHYKIISELGRGGMGIVYKAEDTKLDRTVALKILPATALTSDEDRARFHREAKSAAALNHQHIAAIHEIDEAVPEGGSAEQPRPFIAMEYIDGLSLEQTLKEGPLKLEETVRITSQIAQALGAAHEKDIIHRDIKSANVMLTAKGDVKVLDFGLAKTRHSTMLTRMGSTLGTISYMSPEQAKGENVDHRTDLWALGVVFYELICGRLPFGGDYEQAVTYSIMNEDPEPLTAIRTGVPMGLEWIVTKLLAKKVDDRYQSAKDLLVDLRTIDIESPGMSRSSTPAHSAIAMPVPGTKSSVLGRIPAPAWAAVGALIVALIWTFWPANRVQSQAVSPKKLSQTMSLNVSLSAADISAKGDKVAFITDAISVWDLLTDETRIYPGAGAFLHAEFSNDGSSLLLTGNNTIERISLQSGSIVTVVEAEESGPRANWRDDEFIIYEERQTLYEASITSGSTRRVVVKDSLAGETDLDWPFVLPGGQIVVATVERGSDPARIGFWEIDSGKNVGYLDLPGRRVQWLDAEHLLIHMNGNAYAVPIDFSTFTQTGPIITLAENLREEAMSVSSEGTLLHAGSNFGNIDILDPSVPSIYERIAESLNTINPVDQIPAARYRSIDIHPDGIRAAIVIVESMGVPLRTDIVVLDLEQGTRRSMTRGGHSDYPSWSSSGDSLFFVSTEPSGNDLIMVMATDGTGGEQTVIEGTIPMIADLDVSRDGRYMAYSFGIPPMMDLVSRMRIIPPYGDPFTIETPNGNPRHVSFSSDSRYIAYEDQGGVFVQSVERPESPPFPLWENGMSTPRWAMDDSQVFAVGPDRSIYSTTVETNPTFKIMGAPELFMNLSVAGTKIFATLPDKNRFVLSFRKLTPGSSSRPDSSEVEVDFHFIINLPELLKK